MPDLATPVALPNGSSPAPPSAVERQSGSAETALQQVTSTVFGILEKTLEAGTREIQLVAAQDVIADPPTRFTARRLR